MTLSQTCFYCILLSLIVWWRCSTKMQNVHLGCTSSTIIERTVLSVEEGCCTHVGRTETRYSECVQYVYSMCVGVFRCIFAPGGFMVKHAFVFVFAYTQCMWDNDGGFWVGFFFFAPQLFAACMHISACPCDLELVLLPPVYCLNRCKLMVRAENRCKESSVVQWRTDGHNHIKGNHLGLQLLTFTKLQNSKRCFCQSLPGRGVDGELARRGWWDVGLEAQPGAVLEGRQKKKHQQALEVIQQELSSSQLLQKDCWFAG